MSLKLWLLATSLVATGCSSLDAAACGPDGFCGEEEPKAQDSAQGLLSMGSFVHRPPGSQQEAPAQKFVKLAETPSQPVITAQPPRKSTVASAQKQVHVSAPNRLPAHRLPRKLHLALAQVFEKNKRAQGKGSKMQQQKLGPLSSTPHRRPHHDSEDDIWKNEDLDEDLVEGFDEDLDADEGAGTDVQFVERSTKSKRCTPCQFELYTQEDCEGASVQAIQLECTGDSVCPTKHEVAEGAKVVSIKATRKACVITIKTDKEKRLWFGRSWRKSEFPGCVNLDTENDGYPEEMMTKDMIFCRKRKGNTRL